MPFAKLPKPVVNAFLPVLLVLLPHTLVLPSVCATSTTTTLSTHPVTSFAQSSIITVPGSIPPSPSSLSPNATSISTTLIGSSSLSVSTSVSSSTTSSPAQTTSILVFPPAQTSASAIQQDVNTIHERRLSTIVGSVTGAKSVSTWLFSLGADGKWPDSEVDYTTGCAARRANWPAQEHWQRILVMAAAWHGGLKGAEQFVKDNVTREAISRAMDYWFSRDFENIACLDSGGTTSCPCTNPDNSLWNTNWFSNIILIPDLVGQSCLLLDDTLTSGQATGCLRMTSRSYNTFDKNINGVGFLTGANTLDVASIGIDLALLSNNDTLLSDAYRRVHLELSVRDAVKADGIRADGSFGQHGGILYNGNYGKDYTNDILDIEVEAGGTQFAANETSQTAFATLFDGDRWMIYRNAITDVLHWDFSALGRFISFPVIDNQATGSIKINLTQVRELGQLWSSQTLINFADSLSASTSNANAGRLTGNRMFYNNDYMVHRGRNYVSTVKMFSTRSQNTECVNSQNPLGFHLSDGAVHTYLRGDEYEDIAAAWDWNLIPGTTVDYGATALSCDHTQFTGVERFVGGTSDGDVGLAVMRYTNPFTKSLRWQKTWFFLEDDVQHVMIANVSSITSAPVYSVLDQRRRSGAVVSDELVIGNTAMQTLWHGDIGYLLPSSNVSTVTIQTGQKNGNWSTIGTSTQPPFMASIFAAWLQHSSLSTSVSYSAFPGASIEGFSTKARRLRLQSVQNDAHISALFDEVHNTAMMVFWDDIGGSAAFTPRGKARITISVNGNIAMIYKLNSGTIVVSDPSQSLAAVEVTINVGLGKKPPHWGKDATKSLVFTLPQGGLAGSTVIRSVQ